MFKRFNKLINDLKLHDKHYEANELNMKFLLVSLDHLEARIYSLRERDPRKILYDVLKTSELELFQKKSIQAKHGIMANTTNALIVNNSWSKL